MNIRNLLRTSAFRLTLMYVVLFAASVLILLGFLYWTTVDYLDEQMDRGIEADLDGLREQYRQTGLDGLREDIARRSVALDDAERIYLLASPSFESLAGNLMTWPPGSARRAGWMNLILPDWEEDEGHSEDIRTRALAARLPGGYYLLVGRNLHEREDFYEHTLQVLAAATGLSLILALVGGLVMSNGILRRIDTINRTGRAIMAGHLEERVPVIGSGDEFDQLATHLNAMLDQIQRLMDGMRQVTDNVAHDLRSPLNRLRSRLELTLLTPRENEAYRDAIEQTLRDVDTMLATFNALLSIARVEAGARREAWDVVDMGALARDVVELYQPLAEERGLRVARHTEHDLNLRGDRQLLAQAIGNLIDNALKYTPAGGQVEVRGLERNGFVEISVADSGPGIPADARERVLERFVRLDASRGTPGNGLGLSMVRAVARLHHAELALSDNRPGLKVTLRFISLSGGLPRLRLPASLELREAN